MEDTWTIGGRQARAPLRHRSVSAGPGRPGAPVFSTVKRCFSGPSRSLPRHRQATRLPLRCPASNPCPGPPRLSCRPGHPQWKTPNIATPDALTKPENPNSIQAAPDEQNSARGRLKWPKSLYRPSVRCGIAKGRSRRAPHRPLGRRQVVRQWILIPPCGGSNPPAPASGIIKPSQSSSHLLPSHRAPDDKALVILDFSPQAMSCVRISHQPPRAALN